MSEQSAVKTFYRRFSVGRFQCELIADRVGDKPIAVRMEWSPHLPVRLSPVLLREYRQKRNHAYTALAEPMGGPIVIADFEGASAIHPGEEIETLFQSKESRP